MPPFVPSLGVIGLIFSAEKCANVSVGDGKNKEKLTRSIVTPLPVRCTGARTAETNDTRRANSNSAVHPIMVMDARATLFVAASSPPRAYCSTSIHTSSARAYNYASPGTPLSLGASSFTAGGRASRFSFSPARRRIRVLTESRRPTSANDPSSCRHRGTVARINLGGPRHCSCETGVRQKQPLRGVIVITLL